MQSDCQSRRNQGQRPRHQERDPAKLEPKARITIDGKDPRSAELYAYPATPFDLSSYPSGKPPAPKYDLLLDWMKSARGRSASLDFWARGNYARRLIHNNLNAVRPLQVSVQFVDEMRWTYRRLALLGVPIEFLWRGALSRPVRVSHLHPGEPDSLWDAGWGYLAITNEIKMRGRLWSEIFGYARLLPEVVGDWIVEEGPLAFSRGDVFVAPEELIGLSSAADDVRTGFENLVGALPLRDSAMLSQTEEKLLSLDLPVLDGMAPAEFDSMMADSPVELERLRVAFRRLAEASPHDRLEEFVSELNYEVSELALSDRARRFRATVTGLGGIVGTTAAALGSAAGATGAVGTALVAAAGGVAAAGLCECLRQASDSGLELRRNPLYLLWDLGRRKPFRRRRMPLRRHKLQRRKTAPDSLEDGHFHWLSPPSCGVGFLFVKSSAQ